MTTGSNGSPTGPATDTVLRLLLDRDRWRDLRQLVAENDAIPEGDATIGWFWYDHAVHTAIRLRRLADEDSQSASLGRLLVEVRDSAGKLTRRRYLACWRHATGPDQPWERFHRQLANDAFDRFADADGRAVDAKKVQIDLEALRAAVTPVKLFVNKRLAHHNPGHDPVLTYQQLSEVIDVIAGLWHEYSLLVCQVEPPLGPPADNTNWGAAFDVAWRRASADDIDDPIDS
jgi:hypothetical protein